MEATAVCIKELGSEDYPVEVFNSQSPPEQIQEALQMVSAIEIEQFPEPFSDDYFESTLSDPEAVVVLARDSHASTQVVGFMTMHPATAMYRENFHPERIGPDTEATAYVNDVAVTNAHKKKGLSKKMMTALQDDLVRRGYQYLEIDAADYNPYAASIAHNHADQIMVAEPHESEYGPQVFFKLRLSQPEDGRDGGN